MGSGKSYLCELIAAFAGPAGSANISYPMTGRRRARSSLRFVDQARRSRVRRHGYPLARPQRRQRELDIYQITERVLGVSKAATVGTGALFLGSGNNVEAVARFAAPRSHDSPGCPLRHAGHHRIQGLARRACATNRGTYVSVVLTIIEQVACRIAHADVGGLATYGGAWSDLCRQPLMWLGHPDPATVLLAQIKSDPEAEALGCLLAEWNHLFDSMPVTVREAVSKLDRYPALDDAIGEFPVKERGAVINVDRLGWILKKNADRIVGGFQLKAAMAQGRRAWRVVTVVSTPASPALPASGQAAAKSRELQAADCTLDDLGCLWPSTSHSLLAAFPAANTTACETDDGLPPF